MPAKIKVGGATYTVEATSEEVTKLVNAAKAPLVPLKLFGRDEVVSVNRAAIESIEPLPHDYDGPRVRVLSSR